MDGFAEGPDHVPSYGSMRVVPDPSLTDPVPLSEVPSELKPSEVWLAAESVEVVRLRRVIAFGRWVSSELDQAALIDRMLEAAREITGARYAACGVLSESRRELEQFIVSGIDARVQQVIGDLPRGRGVLGELIDCPSPLRLADIGQHPHSYGFPAGHPPMRTFLGVPILVRGEAWGNLYLAEKHGGEFDQSDEEAVVMLVEAAGAAIEHAGLYELAERHGAELERAAAS